MKTTIKFTDSGFMNLWHCDFNEINDLWPVKKTIESVTPLDLVMAIVKLHSINIITTDEYKNIMHKLSKAEWEKHEKEVKIN